MLIAVNLRPGAKRARASTSLADGRARLQGAMEKVANPLMLAAVAVCFGVAGWLGWVWTSSARELSRLEPQLEAAKTEQARYKSFLADHQKQAKVRDSLVSQIAGLRQIDGGRYVWPHILDEVARALPANSWLVDLTLPGKSPGASASSAPKTAADSNAVAPVQFQVTGRTVNMQEYIRFLRQMEASPWFTQVTPVSATTVVEQERAVTAFTVRAEYRTADSAYIRTVPISQSVR